MYCRHSPEEQVRDRCGGDRRGKPPIPHATVPSACPRGVGRLDLHHGHQQAGARCHRHSVVHRRNRCLSTAGPSPETLAVLAGAERMKIWDVSIVGEIYIDHVMSGFQSWPAPGEEVVTEHYTREIGGGSANTACGLARLG